MAERTEPIRQDIDATRSAMTDKLEQIEDQVRGKVDATVSQAKRVVDVRQHVSERPWIALGAAVTIGYLLGSMGGDDDRPEHYRPEYPRRGEPMRYYATDGGDRGEERRGEHQAQHVRHTEHPQQSQHYQGSSYVAPTYQAQGSMAHGFEGQRFAGRQGRGGSMGGTFSQIVDPLRTEISLIASAAVRSGMRALRESLRESIPQFESEYQAAQREREGPQGHQGHEEGFARAVGDSGSTYGSAGTYGSGSTYGSTGTTGATGTGSTYGTTGATGTGSMYGTTGTTGTGSMYGTTGTTGTSSSTTDRPSEGTADRHNEDPFRPR